MRPLSTVPTEAMGTVRVATADFECFDLRIHLYKPFITLGTRDKVFVLIICIHIYIRKFSIFGRF